MKKFLALAALAAALPVAAHAQDTAPDGSKAFGFVPYVGVLGGFDDYDSDKTRANLGRFDGPQGAFINGVAGVNVPLGPIFVGAEGNVEKGFGDLDWGYGVAGRVGLRAGASGLVFGKVGYEWTNFDHDVDYRGRDHRRGMIYGGGVEVGPKDIGLGGITNAAGPRLRLGVDTDNFKDVRPNAGVIFHF